MFGPRIQDYARRIAELVVRPLAAIGMTPNIATLLGLLLNGATAVVIATGNLRIGGVMLLVAGLFDMVDGALARVRNLKTTFGAFFDSTLDRYSEGLVLLGVILYAVTLPATTTRTWIVALAYVAALSSLMVSYARARAEGLGINLKSGLMARPERVLLLGGGLIIGGAGLLVWTLGILAVTSTFTAVQRIVTVWRKLARTPAAQASSAAPSSDSAREEEPTRRDTPLQRAQEARPSISAIFSSMRRPGTPSRPGRSANR
ncbi:MAG TPA: CDP-alcohol phosphatidyltransferase family protein [Ktedonobacterales bacterium]|jgi:CDP-diacylglycerol---glycerol-3-phosphate 3-phosphatidyltransferase|nr:CDP-alcohol phosphatidyltransferase family protein [Ktedonobacterales bacterium]